MTQNYFVIERKDKSIDNVYLRQDDVSIAFEDLMEMSYDEMKSYEDMSEFVTAVMDAANTYFQTSDEQTVINLIGPDGVFIWGIFIGPGDNEDQLRYAFVNWGKDGKKYRYKKD